MRFLRLLRCRLFGHEYRVHQAFTKYSRRVVCDECGGDWGMNDNVRCIVPWDKEFEDIYRDIFGFHVRPYPPRK